MADLSEVVPQASGMVDIPAPAKQTNGQKPLPFIDRVLRLERGARKSFHASWWDEPDDPCIIYFRPYTLADSDDIQARKPATATEAMVLTIIQKAEREDGSRLFEWGHKFALLREVEATHLNDLADAILGLHHGNTIAEAREELGKTPS